MQCIQVSICVPILKMLAPSSKVLFYCHFPDMLLAPRKSILKVNTLPAHVNTVDLLLYTVT